MTSSVPAAWFAQRVIVGVGELAVSDTTQVVLSTYALGSCVGVAAYDPDRKVGGILHLMLPDSEIAPKKAEAQPAMFADTGLAQFFHHLAQFKTDATKLKICVVGGAFVVKGQDPFKIAQRNVEVTLAYLAEKGYQVGWSDVGGSNNRTVHLDLDAGKLTLVSPGSETEVDLVTSRSSSIEKSR